MNISDQLQSTPKNLIDMNFSSSLIDFSTPRSSVSSRWAIPSNSNTEKIKTELLDRFQQHLIHFQQTQTSLNSLDRHLVHLNELLHQFRHSLDHRSILKPITDQLETRLVQLSCKRGQVRAAIDQSPVINQTLNDILDQISPSTSKCTTNDSNTIVYAELIKAIELNLKKKFDLIEKHSDRTARIQVKSSEIKHRQASLRQSLEKLLDQQRMNEAVLQRIHLTKGHFDRHAEQLAEFQRLNEEYQNLQDENRLLRHRAKENIKSLYTIVSQVPD